MKLAYKAYDPAGHAVAGTIDSADAMAAAETLRRQGLLVAEVTDSAAEPVSAGGRRFTLGCGAGQRLKDVAMFTRQLGVLISSGTQLVDALAALERQAKPGPWRDTLVSLRARIEEGAALSEGMKAYPDYFDSVYQSLVAAGESSGQLVVMLDRLATLKQKQLRVRQAIVGAMAYPCLLTTLAITMFSLLLVFVVPRFAGLFATMNVPLPASTQVLVTASALLRRFWILIIVVLIGTIVAVVIYGRSPRGRQQRDTIVLRLPLIGHVVKGFASARLIRLLGVLIAGHVPVLEALRLIRGAAGNAHYEQLVRRAEEYVTRGEPLSLAFSDARLISPTVHEAIRSGEQSGQMDRLLLTVAEFLEDENEVIVRSLTTIIEPVILIVMGVLVALVAVSMFTPLFDLTAMTQGGGQ